MKLVIVESPTKAKTLSKFLGSEYMVEASMGHVRDLPKSKLGVDVDNNFKPDYVLVEGRGRTIKQLRDLNKKAKELILAVDPDREGEAIGYHVAYILKAKNPKRIVFHEITKDAVEKALKKPGKISQDLVDAQQGRRILDRLVGYKLSPLLWRKVRRGLSAGRVQSVAVKLVVEREAEIKAFVPDEYWFIDVELKGKKGMFLVRLSRIDGKKAEVVSKKQADKILVDLKKGKYVVDSVERKEARKSPPPPYMTSTLQRSAVNSLGWGARKTMRAAQNLYEKGHITYHRTDSLNIASAALKKTEKYILGEFGSEYGLKEARVFKSKSKLAQEAHEAIRPTDISLKTAKAMKGVTQDGVRLYRLIWRRFVASQMAEAIYDRTTINVESRIKNKELRYILRTSGSVTKFDGWLKVHGGRDSEDVELPAVEKGEKLVKKKILSEQKFTEPRARFNEASLIKALEERGIGRPSTYAPIITTIQARQYVEKKERRFYPTAIGEAVVKFLVKHFPKVMDYDFTAGMEESLDEIAMGKKKWTKVIGEFYKPFEKTRKSVEKKAKRVKVETEDTGKKCPTCKKGKEVIRVGRFGKFLSCSRFPDCKYTATFIEKVEGAKCPDCGGEVVIRKTRTGKSFFGCSKYPKCNWASWRKPK